MLVLKNIVCACLLLLLNVAASAASNVVEQLPVLAADIRHGQLTNGLKYFIKANASPAAKVELRLIVNAGSMSEAKEERGVAHLLEHMAFRRTKHFSPQQLKAFLESQGMRIGSDFNAFTSNENTIYQISVASDAAPQALQLLADWAAGIELDAAELELEREVVLDEGRQSQWSTDFYQSLFKVMYPQERYHLQMAIGDVDVVKNIPLAKIKAFYQREYQAQRMAVIVAGDVDPLEVEEKIKVLFADVAKGDLPNGYPIPAASPGLRFFSHRDVWSIAHPVVGWGWILPAELSWSVDTELAYFKRGLLGDLIHQRLLSQAASKESPILEASWVNGHGLSLPTRQPEFSFSVMVKDKQMKKALQALYREFERAKRFGFTQQELDQTFAKWQKLQATQLNHLDWAFLLQMHVQYGQSARDLAGSLQQKKILFAAIKPEDLQAELKRLLGLPDQLATVLLPPAVTSYSLFLDSTAQNIVDAVQAETLENTTLLKIDKPLLSKQPQPGKIISEQFDPATGGTLFILSNGIEVLTTPAKNANDIVGFSARSSGGMAALGKKLGPAGLSLTDYMLDAGLGEWSGAELKQQLAAASLQLHPFITPDQHGFSGETSVQDLEKFLQLQYLVWTAPRDDAAVHKQSMVRSFQQAKANWQSLYMWLNEKHYGENWPYPSFWLDYQFDASLADFSAARGRLFGNPRAFRFVFTGLNKQAQTKQWIEKYIASLPTQPVSSFKPKALAHGRGNELHQTMQEQRAIRVWHAYIPVPATSASADMADFLSQLLQQRLWQALRENTGETYGVYSNYELNAWQGLLIKLNYQTDIKQCDQAAKITVNEIARLRKEAASLEEIKNIRSILIKQQNERADFPMQHAQYISWNWLLDASLVGNATDFSQYTPELVHKYAKAWLGESYWAVGNINCQNRVDLAALRGD